MGQQINQLYQNLRVKLANTKSHIDSLNAKMEAKAQHAEQEVRDEFDKLQKRIEQDRTKVKAAQAEVKNWVDARKSATAAKIAEWKAKHETSRLQNRADSAERYAAASIDVALAAIDDAEQAAIEAWIARQDASAAQAGR
jgi:hypothetical protein